MIIDADVYLEHFGRKGMRWGVRNQSSDSRMKTNGRNFAERLLDRGGSKKMTEIPDASDVYNNVKYSRHWYRINKTLEFLVERTN